MKDDKKDIIEFLLEDIKNPYRYKNDPNNYLIIPEFGVLPSDCDGEGFSGQIISDATKPIQIKIHYLEILTAARVALRATFYSMDNMRDAADIFFSENYRNPKFKKQLLPTIQELALIDYASIIMELEKGLEIINKEEETKEELSDDEVMLVFIAGMHAGSSLSKWISGSPDSLLCMAEKIVNRGRDGGQKAKVKIKSQTQGIHERIVIAAKKLLTEGRSTRDLAGILSARFSYTPKHIRTVLKEANLTGG